MMRTRPIGLDSAAPEPDAASYSLADRLRDLAPRAAASPRIRRWIARVPLIRRVARRQTEALFDLCAGFVYSQILGAFVETGTLRALTRGPLTSTDIARACDLTPAGAERLLRAAVPLGLAARRSGGRFALGLRGAALVDNPGVLAMIRHHRDLYADLADPVALLQGRADPTRISRYWAYLSDDPASLEEPADAAAYSDLMAQSQTMIAETVIASYPFRNHRRILDVGGGTGTFLQHVARAAPAAALTLFDLPAVVANAKRRLAGTEEGARIATVRGDFTSDALPPNQDLVCLVRVVYDHNDAKVLSLLEACRDALSANGRLLIAEPVSDDGTGDRIADAYFGLYLLAMGSGRTRTLDEHEALLHKAGFRTVRSADTTLPSLARLIIAAP